MHFHEASIWQGEWDIKNFQVLRLYLCDLSSFHNFTRSRTMETTTDPILEIA